MPPTRRRPYIRNGEIVYIEDDPSSAPSADADHPRRGGIGADDSSSNFSSSSNPISDKAKPKPTPISKLKLVLIGGCVLSLAAAIRWAGPQYGIWLVIGVVVVLVCLSSEPFHRGHYGTIISKEPVTLPAPVPMLGGECRSFTTWAKAVDALELFPLIPCLITTSSRCLVN